MKPLIKYLLVFAAGALSSGVPVWILLISFTGRIVDLRSVILDAQILQRDVELLQLPDDEFRCKLSKATTYTAGYFEKTSNEKIKPSAFYGVTMPGTTEKTLLDTAENTINDALLKYKSTNIEQRSAECQLHN